MFFSSPSADLTIIIWLLGFSLVVSLGTLLFFRRWLFSLFIFSVLANLVFYFDSGSELFAIYNLKWIVTISIKYWPIINIIFFIFLIIKSRWKK